MNSKLKNSVQTLFSLIASLFIVLRTSRAYLDPGSGSFIIQILIAGMLGMGVAFRSQISRLFGKKSSASSDDDLDADDDEADGEAGFG